MRLRNKKCKLLLSNPTILRVHRSNLRTRLRRPLSQATKRHPRAKVSRHSRVFRQSGTRSSEFTTQEIKNPRPFISAGWKGATAHSRRAATYLTISGFTMAANPTSATCASTASPNPVICRNTINRVILGARCS